MCFITKAEVVCVIEGVGTWYLWVESPLKIWNVVLKSLYDIIWKQNISKQTLWFIVPVKTKECSQSVICYAHTASRLLHMLYHNCVFLLGDTDYILSNIWVMIFPALDLLFGWHFLIASPSPLRPFGPRFLVLWPSVFAPQILNINIQFCNFPWLTYPWSFPNSNCKLIDLNGKSDSWISFPWILRKIWLMPNFECRSILLYRPVYQVPSICCCKCCYQ